MRFVHGDVCPDRLAARFLAAQDSNPPASQTKDSGQELDQGFVGRAFHGSGDDPYFQGVAVQAAEFAVRRTGLYVKGDLHAALCGAQPFSRHACSPDHAPRQALQASHRRDQE